MILGTVINGDILGHQEVFGGIDCNSNSSTENNYYIPHQAGHREVFGGIDYNSNSPTENNYYWLETKAGESRSYRQWSQSISISVPLFLEEYRLQLSM